MGRIVGTGLGYEYVTNAQPRQKTDFMVATCYSERDFRPDCLLRAWNGIHARRQRYGYGGLGWGYRNLYRYDRNAKLVDSTYQNYSDRYCRACAYLSFDFRIDAEERLDKIRRFKVGFVRNKRRTV